MKNSSVNDTQLRSPLMECMQLRPRRQGRKKKMVAVLILTSLVDAFSIMLLYLLTQNTGNGSTVELVKTEKLPAAVVTAPLLDGTVVRITNGQYFINDIPVDPSQIARDLHALKAASSNPDESTPLIIQADRSVDFALLAPVIRAGSVSGFNKFSFAVLQEEGRL